MHNDDPARADHADTIRTDRSDRALSSPIAAAMICINVLWYTIRQY